MREIEVAPYDPDWVRQFESEERSHEARRRFFDIFALGSQGLREAPANVQAITGLGPAIAVGQNLLNRNPLSTLATASGLHPFLRLLYSAFGERHCPRCGAALSVLAEDEIVGRLAALTERGPVEVVAPLLTGVPGSHRTLLALLAGEFGGEAVLVDGRAWAGDACDPGQSHDVEVIVARLAGSTSAATARRTVETAAALGAQALRVRSDGRELTLSRAPCCASCGTWFGDLEPRHFHMPCPHCEGSGCEPCDGTGLHPQAAAVRWSGLRLTDCLGLSVGEARALFERVDLPPAAARLRAEIERRLNALEKVGLGYIALDRSSPTLSRGEAQRVRLAVAMTSRLEDMLHLLDEPTIGLHAADVGRLLEAFRELAGPVVYVEHDRAAAAQADRAIDLGPGAGDQGGRLLFDGPPSELWTADTATARYFSLRDQVRVPAVRPPPDEFLVVRGAGLRNLKGIDVPIPLARLTVVTGVSGSGKSTLVEDVLVASLTGKSPAGCGAIDGRAVGPVLVDQSPIGKNPRSNPATYTKLSDIIRDCFAAGTGLSASHFSFNRREGACEDCRGMGAIEVHMRYLPSTWIPCASCEGQRFSDEVLAARIPLGGRPRSIADVYELSIGDLAPMLLAKGVLPDTKRRAAGRILGALLDIGLGYLPLGQPSPSLSGGEAQRVKLAKFLGRHSLAGQMLVLDEPSTGLHPHDLVGLLSVLDRLVGTGATIVVVEHNPDVIRGADWIIDLGPGAGAEGGHVVYAGPPADLRKATASVTARALKEEGSIRPRPGRSKKELDRADCIAIHGARANNLKGVDVTFPKGALSVVTGVSGSGKSSLVSDVLEAEARRRFLESLSMYERQAAREGPEAAVGGVSGLGVTITVGPGRNMHGQRSTVGTATEVSHHVAVLLAHLGERDCPQCQAAMVRGDEWQCPACGATAPVGKPRHFSPSTYAAACRKCHGVGTLRVPRPEKLIIHPERPLCAGAMYSPGFFPGQYMCKAPHGGYDWMLALAERYDFDPHTTPWEEMTPEAQQAFLFGDREPMLVRHRSRDGSERTYTGTFGGFYGWTRDWDTGGTYTDAEVCPECRGARLREEYAAVMLAGRTAQGLSEMPLARLAEALGPLRCTGSAPEMVEASLQTARKRLRFLLQVGLGYLHLNRPSSTLSAGEAQRIKLAGLLGSGLTSLTVLLDEPSRGLHSTEVGALLEALKELRDEGNTVIVVEHDMLVVRSADHVVDLGPGAGALGGRVVAEGTPARVSRADTPTGMWLRGERSLGQTRARRKPRGWLTIRGARENNLQGIGARLPLGTVVGVCGVSGSGKSTLLIDTLGRALAPTKQTTSVAREPIDPGEHEAIEGAPERTIIVDQARAGVHSPAAFLGLDRSIRSVYAASEDAHALGLDEKQLARGCSTCGGWGAVRMDMGFLPDVSVACETCRGTGHIAEAWEVRVRGVALPDVFGLAIDEAHELLGGEARLARPLEAARDVGLGYLVLRQPAHALSGGEVQRLKIAKELCRRTRAETLYLLDEPTIGQHLEEVARLAGVLHRLADEGHTVVVIEHHPQLLACCDWLLELGPGGGPDGGRVIAEGVPEALARGDTPTAPYLREILEGAR